MRLIMTFLALTLITYGALAKPPSGVKIVELSLPGQDLGEAPQVLNLLRQHDVVYLDLSMGTGAFPTLRGTDGAWHNMPVDCPFGRVEQFIEALVPTGSNHLLLHVRPGNPDLHAANSLTCEYALGPGATTQSWSIARLRGCYLVQTSSVPTAIQLQLLPLPATACGIHD